MQEFRKFTNSDINEIRMERWRNVINISLIIYIIIQTPVLPGPRDGFWASLCELCLVNK